MPGRRIHLTRRRRMALILFLMHLNAVNRALWVHPINNDRYIKGEFFTLYPDLRRYPRKFLKFYRMSINKFDRLLNILRPHIARRDTNYRKSICADERLVLTLTFLATGDSYHTLSHRFRLGKSTVHEIVKQCCDAIWDVLQPIDLADPTQDDWEKIENGFCNRWNFPNCIGALDGKHVLIQAPGKSGSKFFNYKGTFSIVLMALVDHNYRFIYVDIGDYGSNSDGGIFKNSQFGKDFLDGKIDVPPPRALPNMPESGPLPMCLVADEAFPLRVNIMRPYSRADMRLSRMKKIFNYRLSRARRIVENCFGIMAQRFRIFNRRMMLHPENVDKVIKACCVLHNHLRGKKDFPDLIRILNPDDDPLAHAGIMDIRGQGYNASDEAKAIRDIYKTYFNRPEGAVPWQDAAI